ncbi:MAG: START-like domain-containing protein [Bacteroidales bacterium]|nr:START-like domain-containing protein [Bacteroidales bacterium]
MSCYKKFTLEYPMKSSIKVLYEFISTPQGLAEWFAEEITIDKEGIMTFKWYDSEIKGKLMQKKENEYVRIQWIKEHDHPSQFLELRINIEPLSNDLALIVTDFCPSDELEDQKDLWDASIANLLRRIGGNYA